MKRFLKSVILVPFAMTISSVSSNFLPDSETIRKFDQNRVVDSKLITNGDFSMPFDYALFPRNGDYNLCLYRGITSVNEFESDEFVFVENDNTFLRMGNFNGEDMGGGTQTRMAFYPINNKLLVHENMPYGNFTFQLSFSYRFYASEIDRKLLSSNDDICRFSFRGSNNENTGSLKYSTVIINEPDDLTWHTFKTDCRAYDSFTSSSGFFFFFFNGIKQSMNPTYYIDIDNFKVEFNGICYSYLDGSFEQYKDLCLSNSREQYETFFHKGLYFDENLGKKPVFNQNCIELDGSYFGYKINTNSKFIRVAFTFDSENETLPILWLNKNRQITLKDYSSAYISGNKFIGYFDNNHITDIGFSALVDNKVILDNIEIEGIDSINCTPGDFGSYFKNISKYLAEETTYLNNYVYDSAKMMDEAFKFNKDINEFSSQSRLDYALALFTNAFSKPIYSANYYSLLDEIENCFDQICGLNKHDFITSTWIRFIKAVEEIYKCSDNLDQDTYNILLNELLSSFKSLERSKN